MLCNLFGSKRNQEAWAAVILGLVVFATSGVAHGEEWDRPDSPFVMGEAYPDVAATCETANYWINHAPRTDDRVSFAIEGELVAAEWDGALAYLIMCDEPGVQVLCVTYSRLSRQCQPSAPKEIICSFSVVAACSMVLPTTKAMPPFGNSSS